MNPNDPLEAPQEDAPQDQPAAPTTPEAFTTAPEIAPDDESSSSVSLPDETGVSPKSEDDQPLADLLNQDNVGFDQQAEDPIPDANAEPDSVIVEAAKELDEAESTLPADSDKPAAPAAPAPAASTPKPKKNKKKAFLLIGAVVGLLLILGGAAAAYYTVAVPNKPENVLKAAVQNALETNVLSAKGTAKLTGEGFAAEIAFSAQSDIERNVTAALIELTVSGVAVPLEYRYVEDDVYVKIGDLSAVKPILLSYMGEAGAANEALIARIEEKISNKWIAVDNTVLNQFSQGSEACTFEDGFTVFTEADKQLIADAFEQHPFITVANTTSETVDGVDSYRYDLRVSAAEAKAFGTSESIEQLSLVKKLQDCLGEEATVDDEAVDQAESSLESYTLNVWVDKDAKRFNKIAVSVASKDGQNLSVEATLGYDPVTVEKPEGATPIVTLIAELQTLLQEAFVQSLITENSSDISDFESFLEGSLE